MDNKYENAFRKAKSAYGTGAYDDATLEFIFPQLAKSEDDKAYDELVHVVNTHCMDEDRECLLEYLSKWKEIQRFKSPSAQPQPEWSEEDDKNLKCTISFLQTWYPINDQYGVPRKALNKCLSWLEHRFKFLRPQKNEDLPKWKPSKEQIEALECAERWYSDNMGCNAFLYQLLCDLKKLIEGEK